MSEKSLEFIDDYAELAAGRLSLSGTMSVFDGFGNLKISGTQYRVAGKEYVLSEDGSVFERHDSDFKNVHDPAILEAVNRKFAADKTISQARDNLALVLSEGNSVMQQILRIHLEYYGGTIDTSPTEEDGIKFYIVGRNSSHEFYLGMRDGKVFKMAFGDVAGSWDEENDRPIYKSRVSEVNPDDFGYLGHF